jgi:predicted GNAT superfamily acetyltransferase
VGGQKHRFPGHEALTNYPKPSSMATSPADLVNLTANPPANPNAWISAFRKRQLTMFRKAYATQELNSENIRVYLVVERTDNNLMHYWNSETDVDWLPTSDNVVSMLQND